MGEEGASGDRSWPSRAVPSDVDPLVAWGFGAFHAATLAVVGLLVAHLANGLRALAGLSTVTGLVLYGLLWVVAWQATARALALAPPDSDVAELVVAGALWGALAGLAVAIGGIVVVLVPQVIAAEAPTVLVFVAGVGGGGGLVIGGLVGGILALLDAGLYAVAGGGTRTPEAE